jgi:hypothetical protein
MAIYKPGIKIEGSKQYESDVRKVLDDFLASNQVAQVLFKNIARLDHDIIIVPHEDDDGECNAVTLKRDPDAASPEGEEYYTQDDKGKYVKSGKKGTGKGTDAQIHYTPGMFGKGKCFDGLYGSMPDEMLFHEMVHGWHDLQGLNDMIPTSGGLDKYDDEEEFFAIVLTNTYMSAKNKSTKGLRADHTGHTELKAPLNTSTGFLKNADNRKLLVKLLNQEVKRMDPNFILPEDAVPFNPFGYLQAHLKDYVK